MKIDTWEYRIKVYLIEVIRLWLDDAYSQFYFLILEIII